MSKPLQPGDPMRVTAVVPLDNKDEMAKEPEFIGGDIPVYDRLDDPNARGDQVGTARAEVLNGKVVVHIDMEGRPAEILRRGFSLGSFSIREEGEDASPELESGVGWQSIPDTFSNRPRQ